MSECEPLFVQTQIVDDLARVPNRHRMRDQHRGRFGRSRGRLVSIETRPFGRPFCVVQKRLDEAARPALRP
jgi:hypothetical protein